MPTKRMKPFWQGVFPAITTQFQKSGAIDPDATSGSASAAAFAA